MKRILQVNKEIAETKSNIKELSLVEMFEIRGGGPTLPVDKEKWD